ncbi:MAG TPA: CNNM domain-containing protein, partial [Pirellulales bacterium]
MNWELLTNVLGSLVVPLLVLGNAFFVAAEFALVSVRRTRVEEMVNKRRAGAGAVKHAIEHLDDAIAATQLGITLASLALGWVGEPAIAELLDPLFEALPPFSSWVATHTVSSVIAFALI